jgi:uncharacterized protein (TIGR03083 family)
VRDVVSHLVGFELLLRGEAPPAHEGPWPDYVHNPIGELNEVYLAAYRSRPGPEILAQFREVSAAAIARLRQLDDEAWDRMGWSPEGERPYHRFMETRVLDSWIHLQDLRDALLEPADDHGVGEEIVLNRFEAALPYVVGKKMHAPEGFVLRLNLSGRLARSVVIGVRDGRATRWPDPVDTVAVEITTPVALFWRRAAGRVSADAFLAASATECHGDPALARAFADALVIMI